MLRLNAGAAEAHTLLGVILASRGNANVEASEALSQALALNAKSFDARFYLGRVLYAVREYAGAVKELRAAVARFRAAQPGLRVEVEADRLDQVRDFLTVDGIDVILLDNMNCADMAAAVKLGAGRVQFEASGGVTLDTIADIAATGVDFISVGALTHSARAIDFSLELLP